MFHHIAGWQETSFYQSVRFVAQKAHGHSFSCSVTLERKLTLDKNYYSNNNNKEREDSNE